MEWVTPGLFVAAGFLCLLIVALVLGARSAPPGQDEDELWGR